ncbi:transposable element Tc1 transposase [Trichonephila clavipes]|nr:transposable element Tc1 transposase [Trichonephila clavipes]
MSSTSGEKISDETIRRTLHQYGFHGRTPIRKPFIKYEIRQKRGSFAKEHRLKPISFWNAIFSEESKFNLYGSDGRFKIGREAGKALAPKKTIKTVKFEGGGSVLVLGCMSAGGVGELAFIDGIMDKYFYLGILKEKAVHEHEITSKEVLKKVLKEEWAKLSVETTKTLVESMPRRLQAVIQAKGYATKY